MIIGRAKCVHIASALSTILIESANSKYYLLGAAK